jgi:hypothetical protein
LVVGYEGMGAFQGEFEILDANTESLDAPPRLLCGCKDVSRSLTTGELAIGAQAWILGHQVGWGGRGYEIAHSVNHA